MSLCCISLYFCAQFSSKLIQDKQIQHIQLIKQFVNSNILGDPKRLSRQLRGAINFHELSITDADGNDLYKFIKDTNNLPFLYPILNELGLNTQKQTITSENSDFVIQFNGSYEAILEPMKQLVFISVIAPLVLALLFYWLGLAVQKQVEQNYKSKIMNLLNGDKNLNQVSTDIADMLMPFVKSSALSSEQNENDKEDALTGLLSGFEFVKRFINGVFANGETTATFILIRAKDLKQINYKYGFKFGDNYIISLATTIKSVLDIDTELYKINGVDFGIVLPTSSLEQGQALVQTIRQQFTPTQQNSPLPNLLGAAIINFNEQTPLKILLSTADSMADH